MLVDRRHQATTTPRPDAVPMFVQDVFASLRRVDQRRWAQTYLNGLLNVPGRKTLQRLAKAGAHSAASAHGLQQFINSSPWDWSTVRHALARALAAYAQPRAWGIAEVTIPKRGDHSVGVHRRFDPNAGRVINCQQALALFTITDTYSAPVDWRIMLDSTWCYDADRRRRARIPDSATTESAWQHVLRFAERAAHEPRLRHIPWVLDLRRASAPARITDDLSRHHQAFVCEVPPTQPVTAARAGARPVTAAEYVTRRHAAQAHLVTTPTPAGTTGPVLLHSGPVQLPEQGDAKATDALPVHRLVIRPASRTHETARYWITNLVDRSVEEIVSLTQHTRAVDTAMTELTSDFGVLDFEGRSFPGWHHHMTMASAAYAYSRLYPQGNGWPHRAAETLKQTSLPLMRLIS
ncbi:transposase [Streptomyces sp. NPDC005395]|uniref:IS701 family transposase n=1 Tax=Streptomyces sp. NPDC005395 TaxID=3157042 RepID=UPI0033B0CFF4